LLLLPIAFISFMMALQLDGDASADRVAAVDYAFYAWPVLVVLAVAGAWFAFRSDRLKMAWMFMAVPVVWPVVPLAAWALLLPNFF
jgi:hypothetical protein